MNVTADDLAPELRQVLGILQREGPQKICRMASELAAKYRTIYGRVHRLRQLGLVEFDRDTGLVAFSSAGQKLDFRDPANERMGNPYHDAGMTEQAVDRIERSGQYQERVKANRLRRIADLNGDAIDFGSNTTLPVLPDDFVEQAVEQLRIHVRCGNFEAVRELADSLERQWQAMQVAMSPLAQKSIGARLATHLSECRNPADGSRVSVRVINAVEEVCPATLGAICDNWPLELSRVSNVGLETLKLLGQILLGAQLIDVAQYDAGLQSVGCTSQSRQLRASA